jgi:hypothetical protein
MKYTGGCHCGAVRFEADDVDITNIISCNCSYCAMKGLVLTFIPENKFTLLTPEAPLTEYLFNRMKIHHEFCPVCGVQPFGHSTKEDGAVGYAINVRCLDGVDVSTLSPAPFNGKDI